MINKILSTFIRALIAVATLGLLVAMFFIGLVALWYLLIIGSVVWLCRSVYVWWQRKNGREPTVSSVRIFTENIRNRTETYQQGKQGRIIDQED